MRGHHTVRRAGVIIEHAAVESLYAGWPSPVCIVVDGAYGLAGFPGDVARPEDLAAWYEPHIKAWSQQATPQTTLWFWNTEIGWASVHPALAAHGWTYRACHIWSKGAGHIAGNANSLTLRKFPVVTEVCVQYVKPPVFRCPDGQSRSMQEWLRGEWLRTGLPLRTANEVCGVKNAASRKYLTACHLWYFPPPSCFERLRDHANRHGDPAGRPYFSIDGQRAMTGREWAGMRAKFHCQVGVTNLWDAPAVRGTERVRQGGTAVHANQKPLRLIERIIRASSDLGDVVWEPFGGLCPAAVASLALGRVCRSAEILPAYFAAARARLLKAYAGP